MLGSMLIIHNLHIFVPLIFTTLNIFSIYIIARDCKKKQICEKKQATIIVRFTLERGWGTYFDSNHELHSAVDLNVIATISP